MLALFAETFTAPFDKPPALLQTNVCLDNGFFPKAKAHKEDWHLADMNDCFACLTEEGFAALRLSDPLESVVAYEDVESPDLPLPRSGFDFEDTAFALALWFQNFKWCLVYARMGVV